jgi:hypothetical protein
VTEEKDNTESSVNTFTSTDNTNPRNKEPYLFLDWLASKHIQLVDGRGKSIFQACSSFPDPIQELADEYIKHREDTDASA